MLNRAARKAPIILFAGLALVLVLGTAGCGSKAKSATPASETALGSLDVAKSALSTTAPDAKLLVVQTAQAVTPTSSPIWAYLFGSPKSDMTYVVYVTKGKSMGSQEYGQADLTKAQWAEVPNVSEIKIDSDEAYKKALAFAKKDESKSYFVGLQTYVPKPANEASQTTRQLVWYVSLEENSTEAPIEVDAKTGKVTAGK